MCVLVSFGVGNGSAKAQTKGPDEIPITQAGWAYYPSTTSKYNKTEFSHQHTNNGSTTDTVSYSVQITQSAKANTTVSVSLKGMIAQAGVSTQVEWGTSRTTTVKITWTIPAHSKYLLEAGSRWVKTTGTQKYYNQYGQVTSSQSVNGNWTYQTWSTKKEVN